MNMKPIMLLVRSLVEALYGFRLNEFEEQCIKDYARKLLVGLPRHPAVLCSVDGLPWNFRAAIDDLCPTFVNERRIGALPWELDEPVPPRDVKLSELHRWEKSRNADRTYRRAWLSGRCQATKFIHLPLASIIPGTVCEQRNKRVDVPKVTKHLHGSFRRHRRFVRALKGLAA